MSGTTPQPVCTCNHTQPVHAGTTYCMGTFGTACPCPGWTPKPDATTDPFSRGW